MQISEVTFKCSNEFTNIYKYHANCCIQKLLNTKQFIDTIKTIEVFWLNTYTSRSNQ